MTRAGHHPAFALIYGLAPGLLVATARDLGEPLAYALVAAALPAFQRGRKHVIAAFVLLGLAMLTRQTTAVFAGLLALQLVLVADTPIRARIWRPAALLAVAVGPYELWTAIVRDWIPSGGEPELFRPIPFGGLFVENWEVLRQGVTIVTVVLPVLIWMGIALVLLWRRTARFAAAAVLANGLAFMVFRGGGSAAYSASGRIVLGAAVGAALLTPAALCLGRRGAVAALRRDRAVALDASRDCRLRAHRVHR